MRTSWRAAICFCAAGCAAHVLSAQGSGPGQVTARKTLLPIRLDGVLDEPAWDQAGVIRDLTQQSPSPGTLTEYHTEVRVLVDRDTLYLGITCTDPNPSEIAVHTMQRDGDMDGDDSVAFVLDTVGSGVTGYYFRINAAGARRDGLINQGSVSFDWDGIWYAKTRTTSNGWTAEIAVPSLTLRFPNGKRSWLFNIERYVPCNQLTLRWTGFTADAQLADFRSAGNLLGVGRLRQGLSVSPYGLVEATREFEPPKSDTSRKAGVDVSANLGPALTGEFTYKTDFAETDVDDRQINLTRFDPFYPEKRQFFNEGANQFDFGVGLGHDFIPFFSRRVGLYEDDQQAPLTGDVTFSQVPLAGGVKLIGGEGKWGLGALDVKTEDIPQAPGSNVFAGRVTYDANCNLRLGAIATSGNPDGVHTNSLAGVDAVWGTNTFRGDKNFKAGIWSAVSAGDVPSGKRTGYGFEVDYPNDLWDMSLGFREFGDALDPALGFLPRPGTRWYQGRMLYQPRPQHSWARQFNFGIVPSAVTGLDGTTQSWSVMTYPFSATTNSGDRVMASWQPEYERLTSPWEIVKGVTVPPGSYRFDRYELGFDTSKKRPWWLATDVSFGTYYGGQMTRWTESFSYTPHGGHLVVGFTMENDFFHLPQARSIERLFQLKVVYAYTPDLVFSCYGQYDNESDDLSVNARLRWAIRGDTDLYLVYNRDWVGHPAGSENGWAPSVVSDQAVVKLRHTWRR